MQKNRSSAGFTIVELLIVVAIIAILAAVAVPAYQNYVLRSRQADAYHNLLDIKAAEEMFYSMYNQYAGPFTFSQFVTGNTFTKLLSFAYEDTQYYRYRIATASTTSFTVEAEGKFSKLAGNILRITADEDPCIAVPGDLTLSLGLENCTP